MIYDIHSENIIEVEKVLHREYGCESGNGHPSDDLKSLKVLHGDLKALNIRGEQFLHLVNGQFVLETLDAADPCRDLIFREECSLTDLGGLMDKPTLGDKALTLPTVERSVRDAFLYQKILLGYKSFFHDPITNFLLLNTTIVN